MITRARRLNYFCNLPKNASSRRSGETMKKIIKIPLIAIPSTILAVLIFFSLFINTIIQKSVETFGPKMTKTPITLEKAKVSFFSGRGELHGLMVGNPEGFNTPSAFFMGKIKISIRPMSVFSGNIIIREILIDNPEITYETSLAGSNIGIIKKNVMAFSSPSQTGREAPSPAGSKPAKTVQIDTLQLMNGKIRLSATLLQGKTLDIPLKSLQFDNIGKDSGGTDFAKVIQEVFVALSDAVIEAVTGSGKLLESGAGSIGGKVKEVEETAKEGVSKALSEMKKIFEKK